MTESEYKRLLARVVKKLSKAHIPIVADETGLSDKGLRMIAAGEVKRPRASTLERLEEYFRGDR